MNYESVDYDNLKFRHPNLLKYDRCTLRQLPTSLKRTKNFVRKSFFKKENLLYFFVLSSKYNVPLFF